MYAAQSLNIALSTQLLPAHLAVVVEVEVVESESEIVPIVGSRFAETSRKQFIVGQLSIMIHVQGTNS